MIQHIWKRSSSPFYYSNGFSLIELMVVVALVAILASVAIPAYVNQVNRSRQTEALTALMEAKMGQEVFYGNQVGVATPRYANTIGCLACFGSSQSLTKYKTLGGYALSVTNANTNSFVITAQKTVYTWAPQDVLTISDTNSAPVVVNEQALKFSFFKWIFN